MIVLISEYLFEMIVIISEYAFEMIVIIHEFFRHDCDNI